MTARTLLVCSALFAAGFWASCALICTPPSRPFGAGFGIGTVCEKPEDAAPATEVAIKSASAQRMPRWVARDCSWNWARLLNGAWRWGL